MALVSQQYAQKGALGLRLGLVNEQTTQPFANDLGKLRGEPKPSGLFAQSWKNLATETSPAIFAQNLLELAFTLEQYEGSQKALPIFNYLAAGEKFPQTIRNQAAKQAGLWRGEGTFAARSAHWLRFLPHEIKRGETAAGLLLGAGGFGLGLRLGRRAFAGVRGLQGAMGVGATALVGEASATALGYGAIQSLHGEKADFAGLWTNSFALSATYRGLGLVLSRVTHLPWPVSLSQVRNQVWRQIPLVARQELGKFSGVLAVETLLPYTPLNLGGLSTAQDTWFNSLTTYLSLSLHHGLVSSAFPGWTRTPQALASFPLKLKLPNLAQMVSLRHPRYPYFLVLAENRALLPRQVPKLVLPGEEGEVRGGRIKQAMEIGSGGPPAKGSEALRPRGQPETPVEPQPIPSKLRLLKEQLLRSDFIRLSFLRPPSPKALLWFCERLETVARDLGLQNKSITVELIIPNGRNILLIKGMGKEDFTTVRHALFKDLDILSGDFPKSDLIQLNLPRRPSPQELLWFCKRLETIVRESELIGKNKLVRLVLPDKKVILLRKGKGKEYFEEIKPW